MTHSVSHKLILELNGNDLNLVTVNKDEQVIQINSYNIIDQQILEKILAELPDIYASINLLIRKKNFISIPEEFYEDDINKIYELSYKQDENDNLNLDKTDYSMGIVYQVEKAFTDLIKNKFSRVTVQSEVSIVLKKILAEANLKKNKIFVSLKDEQLILFVVSEGKLLLCNPYITKSNDDTFYFVMLAIEQLHLMPEDIELIILGEPPNRKTIFDLFKNYINEINIWLEEFNCPSALFNKEIIDRAFALQLMICG